jgi:TolB-like protein
VAVLASGDIFEFEEFRLDRRGEGLSRRDERGRFVPVAIGPRALDVLAILVERAGQLVLKEDIMAAVWRRTVVENANLTVQISTLRRILDEGRAGGSCIQTVAVRGYRFLPALTRVEPAAIPQGIAPRLSIVVLPFTDLSEGGGQQYFADGMTDDLTTDLSRLSGMFVIARNTAFTYRDKPIGTKQIGQELGVRYVLEGSVRRLGNRVRINAQLIDSATGAHLWAERFDGQMSDLFVLQDEVVSRIAIALNVELISAEAARRADNADALDCMLRGRALSFKPPAREIFAERISLFERALTLDPRSVEAQALLAMSLAGRAMDLGSDSLEDDIKRAETLSLSAMAAAIRNPLVHFARGQVLRVQGRLDEAITEYETVLALDRNHLSAFAHIGRCKILIGLIEEGVAAQEQAIRLSPRDPQIAIYYARIGTARLFQSRVEEAIAWLEKARLLSPNHAPSPALLASAYALRGDGEKAVALLSEAQRLDGRGNFSSIARVRQQLPGARGARGKFLELKEATYLAGLRKAGLPEE